MLSRLKFLLKSQNNQELHSPFVFDLYMNLIKPNLGNFDEKKFLDELKHYYPNKKIILVDEKTDKFVSSKLNEIALIIKPYQNNKKKGLYSSISQKKDTIFSIDFYYGVIFTFDPIAPKQHFFLR
jgi:hypothetical protein